MKSTGFIFFFLLLLDWSDVLSQAETWEKKHFVDIGYGLARSSWHSKLDNFHLYDNQGKVIKSGDLKLRSENNSTLFHLDVSFPLSRMRVGMGISFAQVYMDKIIIESAGSDPVNIFFNESFTFDKLYAVIEIPLKPQSVKPVAFTLKSNVGYFSYYGIKSIDFFGENVDARTGFLSMGLVCNVRIYPRLFIFAYPNFEYMQLMNTSSSQGKITHRIVSGGISGGIRIDMTE